MDCPDVCQGVGFAESASNFLYFSQRLGMPSHLFQFSIRQLFWIALAFAGWGFVYVFQEFDFTRFEFRIGQYAEGHIPDGESWRFAVNKSLRFFFNDLFSLLFIYGLFQNRNYIRIGLVVMAFGLFLLLPVYLTLAILYKDSIFHLLTFLHRITMNPWMMLLLVPAFYFIQMKKDQDDSRE
ncbi:MAG: exosortase F system-associated protein [Bacteroidetes bacterium]|nr:exosortase F system-associated protein [Bacteroidota bacterium]